ncbi:MAG: hypothetical protein M3Z10_01550, partial [Gemmatimonadota bacterium]|nr:hypothetical protein [Gemmatimonadota bacterium]
MSGIFTPCASARPLKLIVAAGGGGGPTGAPHAFTYLKLGPAGGSPATLVQFEPSALRANDVPASVPGSKTLMSVDSTPSALPPTALK